MAGIRNKGARALQVPVASFIGTYILLACFISGLDARYASYNEHGHPKQAPRNFSFIQTTGTIAGPPTSHPRTRLTTPRNYYEYINLVRKPLEKNEMEYSLDLNDESVLKEFDFVPTTILTLMAKSAQAQNTTPEQFIEELRELVSGLDFAPLGTDPVESETESSPTDEATPEEETTTIQDSTAAPDYYDVTNSDSNSTPQPEPTDEETNSSSEPDPTGEETEVSRLEQLKEKYNVTDDCCDPNTITPGRLFLMFPHYLYLAQKPFAVTEDIEIPETQIFFPHSRRDVIYHQVPRFFSFYLFAGLIPQKELPDEGKKKIITIHMYSLFYDYEEQGESIPFRAKCELVKLRMEKSMTTDDRRVRFLQNNDILMGDEYLTSKIEDLYNQISLVFKNKIFWEIFDLS